MSTDRLQRAREHCFMAGVGDVGMKLCEANVPFGLAKIHHVQEQLGVDPDAVFVGAPDATITRNDRRWSQGFGYGGVYRWSGDFTVLDVKPNACGMLVGTLPHLPELEEVRARLHALDRQGLELDGVRLDNDLTESNHFVDVFEVAGQDTGDLDDAGGEPPLRARYVYIMHSSGHEHREAGARGPGLYWDKSQALRAMAREFDTPWGRLHILEGEAASTWYDFYRQVQDFNHRRREALASFLFGDNQVVVNATHQGLVRGVSCANIGCYTFEDPPASDGAPAASAAARMPGDAAAGTANGAAGGPLFPLTLSPTLPAFLVRGKRNVSEAVMERLGWSDRAQRHGLIERITGINVLPHGGGYSYPHLRGVGRVIENGPDDRRFELLPADPAAPAEIVETPRRLPYAYRGMEVKECMEELDLGQAVARLDLAYVLTA